METKHGQKWVCLVTGVVVMMLLGLIYAWSNFVKPLEAEFGWLRSQTSFTFTVSIIFFVAGLNASAKITQAKNTRFTMMVAALSMMIGFILSSMVQSPVHLYGSYGVLVGFGVGLAYNTIVPVVTQWFPGRRSTISGILLMGFGMGGLVLGSALVAAMNAVGWKQTFVALGIVFAAITALSSLVLVAPPRSDTPAASAAQTADSSGDFTSGEMVRRPSYWMTLIWFSFVCSGGLMVISNGSPYAQSLGLTAETAALAVGVVNLSNGIGRVFSGMLCDKAGIKVSMSVNTLFLILSAAMLRVSVGGGLPILPILIPGYALAGLSYGGVANTMPALAADHYGRKNFASNYGLLSVGLVPGSLVGPALSAVLIERSGGYGSSFLFMLALGCISLVMTRLIRRPTRG